MIRDPREKNPRRTRKLYHPKRAKVVSTSLFLCLSRAWKERRKSQLKASSLLI
jgi:hypothetical protein